MNDSKKFYIRLADTSFKEGYRNHARDLRSQHYEKRTGLSKYTWKLKKKGIEYTIRWKVLGHVKGLNKKEFCRLCLSQKFWLIKYLDDLKSFG